MCRGGFRERSRKRGAKPLLVSSFILHTLSRRMPGLSKVIVLDPDARAGRPIQLGSEREGVVVRPLTADAAGPGTWPAPDGDAGVVIVGSDDLGTGGDGLARVRHARAWLTEHQLVAPLVLVDHGPPRADAASAR